MNWPHYMKKREEWYVDYCNSLVHLGGGGGGGARQGSVSCYGGSQVLSHHQLGSVTM